MWLAGRGRQSYLFAHRHPLRKRKVMKKDRVENKKDDQSTCSHAYFNMIEGKLYCSECGIPADEVKKNKVETK